MAYNASFANFDVRPKGEEVADWSVEYYDMLQNKVGGGKNKQKYFFSAFALLPSLYFVVQLGM